MSQLTSTTVFLILLFFQTILNSPVPEKINTTDFHSDLESLNDIHLQNPEELGNYFEGDIIREISRNGLVDVVFRWDKGIIPYEIKGDFPTKDRNLILTAMDMYKKYTCVSFRPRTRTDNDYISITNKNSGCWSKVGKRRNGQEVNLQNPKCTTKLGTPLHELMHAAGFLHEHSRNERDNYVTIHWNNINRDKEHNFDKADEGKEQGFGVPYDFLSVMHYSSYAFSNNGKRTITPKDSKRVEDIGQRRGFSIGDIMKINSMYNCPEKTLELNLTGETVEIDFKDNDNDKEKEKNTFWNVINRLFSVFEF